MLCAIDAISSYGYGARSGGQIPDFVRAHFPKSYHAHARALLLLYRHSMIHSWNLFEASLRPDNAQITNTNGVVCFGLLDLRDAISKAVDHFLKELEINPKLQQMTLKRYRKLKASAK